MNKEIRESDERVGDKCPICKKGNGALCIEHALNTKDFNWLRKYINQLTEFDSNTIYIIEYAITDRKLSIISNVNIFKREEYIKTHNGLYSVILKEIMSLETAKYTVLTLMNNGNNKVENKQEVKNS